MKRRRLNRARVKTSQRFIALSSRWITLESTSRPKISRQLPRCRRSGRQTAMKNTVRGHSSPTPILTPKSTTPLTIRRWWTKWCRSPSWTHRRQIPSWLRYQGHRRLPWTYTRPKLSKAPPIKSFIKQPPAARSAKISPSKTKSLVGRPTRWKGTPSRPSFWCRVRKYCHR